MHSIQKIQRKDSSTENFRFESLKSPSFTDSLGPTADWNWSKSKTNFSRSQFISPCNKLSSFCGWRTRNYALSSVSANTKSKQTNFIKISFNEIKNRDYHLPGLFLTLSSTSGACFLAPKNIPSNCRVIEKLLFWRQTQSWNSWNRSSANIDSVLVEILPRQHRKVS